MENSVRRAYTQSQDAFSIFINGITSTVLRLLALPILTVEFLEPISLVQSEATSFRNWKLSGRLHGQYFLRCGFEKPRKHVVDVSIDILEISIFIAQSDR